MKPLWASVFMMLAMFLQSSAERAQRRWVRTALRPRAAPGHSRDLGQPQGRPRVPSSPAKGTSWPRSPTATAPQGVQPHGVTASAPVLPSSVG